jgi:hypothetical protein
VPGKSINLPGPYPTLCTRQIYWRHADPYQARAHSMVFGLIHFHSSKVTEAHNS